MVVFEYENHGRDARATGFSKPAFEFPPEAIKNLDRFQSLIRSDGHRPFVSYYKTTGQGWPLFIGHTDVTKKNSKSPNRKVAVFVTLVAMIAFTSVLLLVLAPPPLQTLMWRSLFALDSTDSLDKVFQTQAPVASGRWRYIYVHHSRTPGGDAVGLAQQSADHFVIGNGDGAIDGEIQMTQSWNHQDSIGNPPLGASHMDPGCISICVVGDFDRTRPTETQLRRLGQLVGTLQEKLHIGANDVQVYDLTESPAGIGHSFPIASFRNEILP
jgi:hypothetical protein